MTNDQLRLLGVHFPQYQSRVYPATVVLQSPVQVRAGRPPGHPNSGNSRTGRHSLTLPNLQAAFAIDIITPAVSCFHPTSEVTVDVFPISRSHYHTSAAPAIFPNFHNLPAPPIADIAAGGGCQVQTVMKISATGAEGGSVGFKIFDRKRSFLPQITRRYSAW